MKYLIIGAGGTGGVMGAYLSKAGKDVTLIARGEHLQAIQENGLRLETSFRNGETVSVKAVDMEHYKEKPDVIFVCVKGYSLERIIPFIEKISGKETVVIPILNIYGTGRKLQERLPELLITDGCIYVSANIVKPGVIAMHGSILKVIYGLPDHKTDHPVLKKVERDLNEAGIEGIYSSFIEKDALQKFSNVSPMAACGLYYHAEAKEIQKEGKERAFYAQLVDEIQTLAGAMGITYEEKLSEVNLAIVDKLAPTASTSMQRDIYAGKSSEIDGLIYEVVRTAKKYGISLPGYEKAAAEFRKRDEDGSLV